MALLIIGVVLLTLSVVGSEIGKAHAAGGPTEYAVLNGHYKGLVQVENFDSPLGSQAVARIQRPTSGVVFFCFTAQDGAKNCGTVNPDKSGFDKASKGCSDFTITFPEAWVPTRVEIFDSVVTSLTSADFSTTAPANIGGYLNICQ